MIPLYDAHNHLQDARLRPWIDALLAEMPRQGIRAAVVNGTREADWADVRQLAEQHSWIRPAYGLHPWYVGERSPDWLETLAAALRADPRASLGEVGLDRWIEGHDVDLQSEILRAQWRLAAREDRVATVHCLRAWGPLVDFLRAEAPLRAFVLHSYGGSADLVREFAKRGAYFSFSPYFLHARKAGQREVFQRIPLDRLLVETDAPDMAPPAECNEHPLADPATGATLNHPLNLSLAYRALAETRGLPVEDLAHHVEENFARVFGL